MPVVVGLADLGVLLALAVLIGLSWAYRYSLGALIVALAKLLGSVRLPNVIGGGRILGFAADALTKVDSEIRHALGRGVADMQAVWNETLSYTAQVFHWIGKEIASVTHDAAQAIEGLHVTDVTNVYKRVNPGLAARVGALAGLVAALTARVTHLAERPIRTVTHEVRVVEHAIAIPDIAAVPKAIPGYGQLTREAGWARGQIKRLARTLTPAGIIGLVGAATLGGFGLGWLRCKGVGRVGRSLCGLSGLIEALYAGTIATFAVSDLCRFAYGIERVAEQMQPLLLDWVDVEDALLRCSAASYPKPLRIVTVSRTPVVDPIVL